ncbi:hypothetical protein A8B78_11930 [Jannaschia sp. EhC01]|nr:hypothetical protein A8B78_11930 [Jannaschia sp. EhC01]
MTRLTLHILRPLLLWAVHFIAIYALISAACAPRLLLEVDAIRVVATIMTAVFAVLLLVWLIRAGRVKARMVHDDPASALATAAWWSLQISLLAIVANLWPIAIMTTCTG